jgi:hypothetical protein
MSAGVPMTGGGIKQAELAIPMKLKNYAGRQRHLPLHLLTKYQQLIFEPRCLTLRVSRSISINRMIFYYMEVLC